MFPLYHNQYITIQIYITIFASFNQQTGLKDAAYGNSNTSKFQKPPRMRGACVVAFSLIFFLVILMSHSR